MGKGLGPAQLNILSILEKAGGALAVGGILARLFDKASLRVGSREYSRVHTILSRSVKGLRTRGLVETYTGVTVAGRAALVVALTSEGKKVAEGL